jgi:hypothetical protein
VSSPGVTLGVEDQVIEGGALGDFEGAAVADALGGADRVAGGDVQVGADHAA